MGGHSLRAYICGVLLVPLAWIGIVLLVKFHGRGVLVPALLIWGVVLLVDLWFVGVSVARARRCRMERTREPELGQTVKNTPAKRV